MTTPKWHKAKFGRNSPVKNYSPFNFPILNKIFNTKEQKIFNKLDPFDKAVIMLSIHVIFADGHVAKIEKITLNNYLSKTKNKLSKAELSFLINKFTFKAFRDLRTLDYADVNWFKSFPKYNVIIYEINSVLKDKIVKNNLAYLLFAIAFSDSHLENSEKKTLLFISLRLGLSKMDVARLYAFFEKRIPKLNLNTQHRWEKDFVERNQPNSKKQEYKKKSSQKKKTAKPKTHYRLDSAFIILGIPRNSDSKGIKKAYKKLALLYHPDRFMQQNQQQQNIARERFMKMKDAYELIKRVKKFK